MVNNKNNNLLTTNNKNLYNYAKYNSTWLINWIINWYKW